MAIKHSETWHPAIDLRTRHQSISDWLTHRASLTARLRACSLSFRIELIHQGLSLPHRDEAFALGLGLQRKAWVREVYLLADNQPVVYARTVTRHQTAMMPKLYLHKLGSKPLGEVLFKHPDVRRAAFFFRRLDQRDSRYHTAAAALETAPRCCPKQLWARRSCFFFQRQSILVSETFLPAIQTLTL